MMEWRTNIETRYLLSDVTSVRLPGSLLLRILLWLLIFAAFPLSVTAARLSFNLEVLGRSIPAALPPERTVTLAERVLLHLEKAERKESDPWLQDAAHTIGVRLGLSADLGTQLRQNIDGKNGQVTGSAQRAQLRCGRKSDKLGRAEESSGSLDISPRKPCASERNPRWRKAA